MTFGCSVIFVVVFYTARSKQQYERLALAETDDRRCSLLHITRDVYERVFACVCVNVLVCLCGHMGLNSLDFLLEDMLLL